MARKIPVSCTLTVVGANSQSDEWVTLASKAVEVQRQDSGVTLVLSEEVLAVATDLAQREATCCSFLNFEISAVHEGQFELIVTTETKEGEATLAAFAGELSND